LQNPTSKGARHRNNLQNPKNSQQMLNIFLIAIGGALGSVARYLFSESIINLIRIQNYFKNLPTNFPWQTFSINVIGSLLAGVLYYFMIKHFDNFDLKMKNLLMVGFLGGFTTFSAFSLDFFRLFTAGQINLALIYALSSVTISILALFFGFYLTKFIFA
jgi:CrcB protein